MPQWEAFTPMQVWSWDITMLPGPYRGINYCLSCSWLTLVAG